MFFETKNMPDGVKLVHALNYQKITGKSSEVNLQREDLYEHILSVGWRMVKTCKFDDGVGLAAPQIGIPKKIIICKEFYNPSMWDFTDNWNLFINPSYRNIPNSDRWTAPEGCLSVPYKMFDIERPYSIEASYYHFDGSGNLIKAESVLEGYPARIYLHEYDHLIGKSIVQRFNEQSSSSKKTKKSRKKR